MNGSLLVSRLILVFMVLTSVSGVQAFEISNLQIQIETDGSASVQVFYTLSEYEKGQYVLITSFLNPVSFGEEQFEKLLGRPVTIYSVSSDSAILRVSNIAKVRDGEVITPAFNFTSDFQKGDNYLITLMERFELSFIPAITTITFPDGHSEIFSQVTSIPSIRHQMGTP